MLPGMELMDCPNLAVPRDVMQHVVKVESSYNPYAIGVVGGRLQRQPKTLSEALATVRMLEGRGFNFSLGLAQVNRHNLAKYGLTSYEHAFQACPNIVAGSRILAECHGRSGRDWGKSFSCYYSGNFTTGFRHGYVQKVYASMQGAGSPNQRQAVAPIAVAATTRTPSRLQARVEAGVSRTQPLASTADNERNMAVDPPTEEPVRVSLALPEAPAGNVDAFLGTPTAPLAAVRAEAPTSTAPRDPEDARDSAFVF